MNKHNVSITLISKSNWLPKQVSDITTLSQKNHIHWCRFLILFQYYFYEPMFYFSINKTFIYLGYKNLDFPLKSLCQCVLGYVLLQTCYNPVNTLEIIVPLSITFAMDLHQFSAWQRKSSLYVLNYLNFKCGTLNNG